MSGLVVERVTWSAAASKMLKRAAGEDLEGIAEEVRQGISRLWWCKSPTSMGYIVTRLEKNHGRDELVLVLGEGRGFNEVVEYLLKIVEERGLSFRVHVKRRALVKMFEKYNVNIGEYVLVKHGR